MTTASTSSALTSTLANTTAATTTPNASIDSAKLASPSITLDESTANGFTTAPATSEEDNLDYESEDDDDSRSNYSTHNTTTSAANNASNNSTLTNSSGRGGRHHGGRHSSLKGEETKRSHHNVLERKRRDLLKDSFTKLRDSVLTSQPKERVSRAEILKQAADFIQLRVQKNAAARAELDELIRKNQELEQMKLTRNSMTDGAARLLGTVATSIDSKEPTMKQEH